jgi:hypothetical protein
VDCDDRVVPVELAGKEMAQLEGLYRFSGFLYLTLDFPDEEVAPFFLKDVERVFDIGNLPVEGLKGDEDILCLGLLFLEFVEFFGRGPERF